MNDPLDQQLSAHFKAPVSEPLSGPDFSRRVLAALPPAAAPQPAPARWLADFLSWETALLAAVGAVIIGFCFPADLVSTGFTLLDELVAALTTWPALLTLGSVAAVLLLQGEDEEDEARGGSAWF